MARKRVQELLYYAHHHTVKRVLIKNIAKTLRTDIIVKLSRDKILYILFYTSFEFLIYYRYIKTGEY